MEKNTKIGAIRTLWKGCRAALKQPELKVLITTGFVLLVVGLGVWELFAGEWWRDVKPSDRPAWLQAFGALIAIFVTMAIPIIQDRMQKENVQEVKRAFAVIYWFPIASVLVSSKGVDKIYERALHEPTNNKLLRVLRDPHNRLASLEMLIGNLDKLPLLGAKYGAVHIAELIATHSQYIEGLNVLTSKYSDAPVPDELPLNTGLQEAVTSLRGMAAFIHQTASEALNALLPLLPKEVAAQLDPTNNWQGPNGN